MSVNMLFRPLQTARSRMRQADALNRFARRGLPFDKLLMLLQLCVFVTIPAISAPSRLVPVAAAVATAMVIGSVYNYVAYPRYMVPGGGIITALIIGGILLPNNVVLAAGLTAAALVLKYLISPDGRNIFNPAALGLYLGAVVFGAGMTWWAAGSMLVFVLGTVTAYLVKVHDIAFSFLVPYWLLTFFVTPSALPGSTAAFSSLLESYVTFFALVMVVEPVTSPNTSRSRILYGAEVAVLVVALQVAVPVLPAAMAGLIVDNLLLALLIMNAVHRILPDKYMA